MKPGSHRILLHERCCHTCSHCYTIWPTGDAFCLHGDCGITLQPEESISAPHYPGLPIVSLLVPCDWSKHGQYVGLERDDLYSEWLAKCDVTPHYETCDEWERRA